MLNAPRSGRLPSARGYQDKAYQHLRMWYRATGILFPFSLYLVLRHVTTFYNTARWLGKAVPIMASSPKTSFSLANVVVLALLAVSSNNSLMYA